MLLKSQIMYNFRITRYTIAFVINNFEVYYMNSLNNHGMITPHGALSPSGDLNTIVNVLTTLPTTQESIPNNFLNTPEAHIKQSIKDNTVNSEPINACLEGPNLFESVLSNLDKLKNRLGGSPNFYSTPTINMEDNSTTFFGIPIT